MWFDSARRATSAAIQRGAGLRGRRRGFFEPLERRAMLAAAFAQFVDPDPSSGDGFGSTVLPLSTGNVVITSPFDDYGATDVGAVYLFSGATGALISTVRGSHAKDTIGNEGVTAVGNGNFVFASSSWDSGAGRPMQGR